ncbi:IS701 family transposase, partial [Bradyrhizobium sp. UFLA 03-164]|nr:IS701 family transposase [Bradyrhizobium uaiense]
LQHRRLAHAARKKKNQRASASTNHARSTSRHRRSHPSAAVSAVPTLPKTNP